VLTHPFGFFKLSLSADLLLITLDKCAFSRYVMLTEDVLEGIQKITYCKAQRERSVGLLFPPVRAPFHPLP